MIFNRFIAPLRGGGGDTPRMIELFLDWGKLEIFGKIQPIRPPPHPRKIPLVVRLKIVPKC